MEIVRVRVMWEDPNLLSEEQMSVGLQRCWLLLKPQHNTISDLSSYLLHLFNLNDSCPDGLLLSMDDFVLPSFESTGILKDKDIISVKRKMVAVSDVVKVGDGANCSEDEAIVEKQHLLRGVQLLPENEEFDEETGGYESESEEDEPDQPEETVQMETASGRNAGSKKRKTPGKLKSPKRKKNKRTNPEKCPVVPEHVENGVYKEQNKSCDACTILPKKGGLKKCRSLNVDGKPNNARTLQIDEKSNHIDESVDNGKSSQLQENGRQSVDVASQPDGTRKYPSRSARRKMAKRKWLREQAKVENNERQTPETDVQKSSAENQQPAQNSDMDDGDIVPIVIRPGHIRFEPLGKDQTIQQNQPSLETFQWNGITSKKKGQKWGKEKMSSRRNDHKDFDQHSEIFAIEEETPSKDPMDFNKFPLLTSSPKEGDTIAYRLIELSSNWTPELSSFRVGKVSSYDPEANKITLVSVPEYPIVSEKSIDEATSALQPHPDNSLCREDGSLEMDFSLLIDVRIIKCCNSYPEKAVTAKVNEAPVDAQDAVLGVQPNNKNGGVSAPQPSGEPNINQDSASGMEPNIIEMPAPSAENEKVDAWDEINEVLSAKKAQLSRKDGSGKKESSGRSPWSYRALRGNALGPTMSLLRAQNNI